MKFGILLNHEYPKTDDLGQRIDELIEMTHAARDSGYDFLFGMHHYLSSLATIQAVPLLARLIPESGSMRLGTGVYLATYEHPVHVAETWASLDQLSGGRFILGAGAGYRKNEFAAFGLDRSRRWSRMSEHLELLKLFWSGEEVNFHGEHFTIDGERCSILPAQETLPIWIGANAEKTIRRAAHLGDAWIAPPNVKTRWVKGHLAYFKDELEQMGVDLEGRELPLIREMYIGDTDASASAEAEPFIRGEYAEYSSPEYGQDVQLWRTMFDEFLEKAFLFGSADTISDKLADFADAGFNVFIFRVSWSGMPFELALENIRRFGVEVIPRFQEARV